MESKKNNVNTNATTTSTIEHILREIEVKTEKKIVDAYKTGKLVNPITSKPNSKKMEEMNDITQNIMQNGAKEFEEKTGRNMSYGEMRAAWG